jgi:hypothetical protein
VWTGLKWLIIRPNGRLLKTGRGIVGLHKAQEIWISTERLFASQEELEGFCPALHNNLMGAPHVHVFTGHLLFFARKWCQSVTHS